MSKRVLERYWKGPADLRKHPEVSGVFSEIQSDIRAGRMFPALRENEIHLYHEGGRVLRIRPRSAYTHRVYDEGVGVGEVPVHGLTKAKYREIKERCGSHNSKPLTDCQHRETWIVSRLFRRFSVWADEADPHQPKLIDVEVRLRHDQGRSAEMVDLLFLDDDARLTFVEVKRQYDSRVRSQNTPEVVEQVSRYETALSQAQDTILSCYRKVGSVLSEALGLKPFVAPNAIFPRVPILVCRRDDTTGRDTWLRHHLCLCGKGEIDPRGLVVDGGGINEGAYGDTPLPPWCADGLWENLNLKMVFEKIRSLEEPASAQGSTQ